MQRRFAFTLIELLVVLAILGLLIGIIAPSLSVARTQARRTTCATNLRQVGVALVAYMRDSRDRMPHISYMPSIGPAPLTTDDPIYFADVLERHLKGKDNVLQCPDDRPGKLFENQDGEEKPRDPPNGGLSYFQSERSSYEYRYRLAGLTPKQFYQAIGHPGSSPTRKVASNTVWVSRDYANFHGKAGEIGARRYVYIDGHVTDYEN